MQNQGQRPPNAGEKDAKQTEKRRQIIEISLFVILAIAIVLYFGLKNETLLLLVLIFGIYLVVSGRISKLKFMDFEVNMKVAEDKGLDLGALQAEADVEYFTKDAVPVLHEIVPKLIREAKKVKVLRLTKRYKDHYDEYALLEYLKYFTHVVFIDDSNHNMLMGFAEGDRILGILKEHDQTTNDFMNSIRNWTFSSDSIIKDGFVINTASRKEILDMMKQQVRNVLPVVSIDRTYRGVVDYDSIIWQITKDFYTYTKPS